MWENWEKTKISSTEQIFSYLLNFLDDNPTIVIELTVMLIQSKDDPSKWKVLITAFHPSSGEYVDFDGVFSSFEEAEKAAWDQAQKSIDIRKSSSSDV